MTGKHAGNASVRANDGAPPYGRTRSPLPPFSRNKATLRGLRQMGVRTKAALASSSVVSSCAQLLSTLPHPQQRGSSLCGNNGGRKGQTYARYTIFEEAVRFIRENSKKPFFATSPSHHRHVRRTCRRTRLETLPKGSVDERSKSPQDARITVMVSMLDRQLGEIMDLIKELRLEQNAVIFFTGDNGGQDRFKSKDSPADTSDRVCPSTVGSEEAKATCTKAV